MVEREKASNDNDDRRSAVLKLCTELRNQAEAMYLKNIPAEYVRLLEPHLVKRFGAVLYFLILATASGIFAYLFNASLSKVYLSPDRQSNCVSVDRPVTGSYLGDLSGHWSGTADFDPSRAPYKFVLQNFSLPSSLQKLPPTGDDLERTHIDTLLELYRIMMASVSFSMIHVIRPIMMRSNYASNLVYLMMWSASVQTGDARNEQVFSFTGSPQSVFEALPYQAAGLGTAQGQCSVLPRTAFNSATQRWTISWPFAAFIADGNCTAALPPSSLGRVQSSDTVEISLDIRSFFAAVAANTPPPPVREFQMGDDSSAPRITYEQVPILSSYNYQLKEVYWSSAMEHIISLGLGAQQQDFYVGQYWDARYPGMEAIFCVTPVTVLAASKRSGPPPRKQCFVNAGGALFAVPIFDSYGVHSNVYGNRTGEPGVGPEPCRCNLADGGPLSSANPGNCHNFDFLSSLVFFSTDMLEVNTGPSTFSAMMAFLAAQSNKSDELGSSLAEQAHAAAWYTAPHLTASNISYTSFNYVASAGEKESTRRGAFSFCETATHDGCSILSIRSAASNALFSHTYKASPGYFSFSQGFCNFSLLEPGAFEKLARIPPVSLEQDYYRCVPMVTDTLVLTFGVSLSNTLAIAPVLAMAFVGSLLLSQWFMGRSLPRAFSAAEKDEVLGLLATRILLQRRGHHCKMTDGGSDKISASQLQPAPTVAAISAELDPGDADTASSPLSTAAPQIFICEPPSATSPAAALQQCCRRNGRAEEASARTFQVDSPLPRGKQGAPLALSVDAPSEKL